MTAKEQASSLVEYFWTDVEEFKQYEAIRMTKEGKEIDIDLLIN